MSRFIGNSDDPSEGAFGEVVTGELTPQVQLTFGNTTPAQLHVLTAAGGSSSAAVDTTTRTLKLQTGAAATQAATFESVQPAAYHPGQGALVRFTAVYTTGVAGSKQFIGVGDASDGFFMGYNGTDWGILRRYGGSVEVQTLVVKTASDAGGGDFTITLDGDAKTITVGASQSAAQVARAIVGTDFTAVGTGWRVLHADIDKAVYAAATSTNPEDIATVYFVSLAAEAKGGAFTLTDVDSGVTGEFVQNAAGVAPTEQFVAKEDFNVDTLDGTGTIKQTIDFTKGNVFQIRYQWLGFGQINFYMEDPDTGRFSLLHELKYANTATTPATYRPTYPLRAESINTSNTSNITLQTASFGAFTEGTKDTPAVTYHGAERVKAGVSTTEVPIIAIKNDLVFNGIVNRHRLRFKAASIAIQDSATPAATTSIVTFRARAGVYLTSTMNNPNTVTNFVSNSTALAWNFTQSSARVDVTSVGVDISSLANAGILQFATTIGGVGSSQVFDLSENFKDALLPPGGYFCITAEVVDGANADVAVVVNWEDIFA